MVRVGLGLVGVSLSACVQHRPVGCGISLYVLYVIVINQRRGLYWFYKREAMTTVMGTTYTEQYNRDIFS